MYPNNFVASSFYFVVKASFPKVVRCIYTTFVLAFLCTTFGSGSWSLFYGIFNVLFFFPSTECTDNFFNYWTAVLQEDLTSFYFDKLLCFLCFLQSMIMHIKHGQKKPNGMRCIERTCIPSGVGHGTCTEPLSPERSNPDCVAFSYMRKLQNFMNSRHPRALE